MPKINVYLPEDLAAAVRAADFPVSPVCQQALAEAVRRVNLARKVTAAIRDPDFDPSRLPEIVGRMGARMAPRLHEAARLAQQSGGAAVDTGHLLLGILDVPGNLALRILTALDVDPDDLRTAADQARAADPAGQAPDERAGATGEAPWQGLTLPARRAVAAAVDAAINLGHNYIGCEHLLLGLAGETDDIGGRALRDQGVEPAGVRRAIVTIVAGFTHARETAPQADNDKLDQILRRLDALEQRVATIGG